MRRLISTLLAAFAVLAVAVINPTIAHAYDPIKGSGSSWSKNALDQWKGNVTSSYGMSIDYDGQGSTRGRGDFIDGLVDFAVSEIPFQARPEDGSRPENPQIGFAYLPIVAGGTSFMYNLKIGGQRVTNLRLNGEVLTKIFTGAIKRWNDPAIQADNPALAMPDKAIIPIIRSEGSGTSAQFTLWMSKQYPNLWPHGMRSNFPPFDGAKGQSGSDGVAGYVSQDHADGAITYVEYSYAKNAKFPVAKVLNKAGYYIEPTASSVAVALTQAKIASDLTQNLDGVYNSTDPRSYPLSSYSYAIVPTEVKPSVNKTFTAGKGESLAVFLRYVLCDGQRTADPLGYSPLPMNLVMAGSDQVKRIPGAGDVGINFDACNNPTFRKGDSPEKNLLAQNAPQPQACDKQGADQCLTGTGGARTNTRMSGNGGSGAGGAPQQNAGGGNAGTAGGGGTTGGTGGGGGGRTVAPAREVPTLQAVAPTRGPARRST